MIALAYNRVKALRWTWVAMVLATAVWITGDYRPADEALRARGNHLAAREAAVRQARAAVVALGPAGLDSALTQFRTDSALLALRVPADSVGSSLATEVRAVLGAWEGRGLRVVRTDPIPRSAEGGFLVTGYAVTVVGRFAAIRGLLDDLSAQPRLLRVRRFRLAAVPDSMVGSASAPAGGPALPPDTASAADAVAASGAEPFEAVVTFHVVWYTRSAAPTGPDSAGGGAITPSPGLLP